MGTQGAQTKEDLQPLFLGLSASSLTKYKLYIIIIYYEYYINHLSVPQRTAPSLIELSLLLQETCEIAETIQSVLVVRPKLRFEAIRCSPVQRLSLRGNCHGQMYGAMGAPRRRDFDGCKESYLESCR